MAFNFFLRLAYVGTEFFGWQIQTHLRSVQNELWKSLRRLDASTPLPQGTGRTDAGVHALAQGVLVDMTKAWEPYRLLAALNAHLPPDIRVMSASTAPEGFFPRQHAVAKRYIYRIQEGPAEDPFSYLRLWHLHGRTPLNRDAVARAMEHFVGERDFSSFRNKECAAKSPIRKIYGAHMESFGSRLDLVFEGNRFLMHQVRIMTGTLVDIGKGRLDPDAIPKILLARDRRSAGITAPPHGLYLDTVWYQKRWDIGDPSPWGEEDVTNPELESSDDRSMN